MTINYTLFSGRSTYSLYMGVVPPLIPMGYKSLIKSLLYICFRRRRCGGFYCLISVLLPTGFPLARNFGGGGGGGGGEGCKLTPNQT